MGPVVIVALAVCIGACSSSDTEQKVGAPPAEPVVASPVRDGVLVSPSATGPIKTPLLVEGVHVEIEKPKGDRAPNDSLLCTLFDKQGEKQISSIMNYRRDAVRFCHHKCKKRNCETWSLTYFHDGKTIEIKKP